MICKSCENVILKSEKYFRPPHGGFRHEECMPAKMRRNIECLQERISTLEAALREIAEHPKQEQHSADNYSIGVVDGHRCAAAIARKALEGK